MKKIIDIVTQNIWLLLLALIAALFGLTLLIGASFENVERTAKKMPGTSAGEPVHSESESSIQPTDMDDFLSASGAFGDWEDFSSFYEDSNPVSSATSRPSSSRPSSSKPAESVKPSEPSKPAESSNPSAPPAQSVPDGPASMPEASSSSTPSTGTPGEGSAPVGGDSPMDAPSLAGGDNGPGAPGASAVTPDASASSEDTTPQGPMA